MRCSPATMQHLTLILLAHHKKSRNGSADPLKVKWDICSQSTSTPGSKGQGRDVWSNSHWTTFGQNLADHEITASHPTFRNVINTPNASALPLGLPYHGPCFGNTPTRKTIGVKFNCVAYSSCSHVFPRLQCVDFCSLSNLRQLLILTCIRNPLNKLTSFLCCSRM